MVRCENHKHLAADDQCEICRKPFCRECIVDIDRKKYCKDCLKTIVKRDTENQEQKTIHTRSGSGAGDSSWGIFIFLVIAGIIVIRFFDEIKEFIQDIIK